MKWKPQRVLERGLEKRKIPLPLWDEKGAPAVKKNGGRHRKELEIAATIDTRNIRQGGTTGPGEPLRRFCGRKETGGFRT